MAAPRMMQWWRGHATVNAGFALQIVTFVGFLAVWEVLGASGLLYKGVVPSVVHIAAALVTLIGSSEFWFNLSVTGMEVGLAIVLGGSSGIVVGLVLGGNRFIGRAFQPYVNFFASMPKVILFPVFLVAFGTGPGSKVAIGAVACFFPMALGTAAGTRQISSVLIDVGRSFDLSLAQMVRMVYLPALVEPIMSGFRIALGVAIIVCMLAEFKYSNMGIGFAVITSYNQSRFADVYAVLIIIFAITMAGNNVIDRLAHRRGQASPPK
jgi:ABC-type nitrate/sulfonate/bicarbonate transport system permease component